jgi:hypothetical protein
MALLAGGALGAVIGKYFNGGGEHTKNITTVDLISAITNHAIARNVQNCGFTTIASQTMEIISAGCRVSNITQTSALKLNAECLTSSNVLNEMINNLKSEIDNSGLLETESFTSLFSASSKNEVRTQIHQTVDNIFEAENIQNTLVSIETRQVLRIEARPNPYTGKCDEGGVNDIIQSFVVDMFVRSVSEQIVNNHNLSRMDTDVQQAATSLQKNPISNIIDSLFGGLGDLFKNGKWIILQYWP